jgi:hypothetical protein
MPALSRSDTPRDQRAERIGRGGECARLGKVAGTDHRTDDEGAERKKDSLLFFAEDIILLKQNHIVGVI